MAEFRGASADALQALSGELRGVGQDDLARVGGDLFAVADILRSEPALRRVVTDVSVAPGAKQGLVRQILGGRLSEPAVALVAQSVAQRWTAGRDLAYAVERLGEIATVRSAGDQGDRLENELFEVGQLVKGDPALRDAFSDPARSNADKARLVDDLLASKALPATVALVRQALAGTYRTVGVALATYERVAADVNGERVATVTVAQPLADADRSRLADVLSRQYSRPVHLNVVVDPSVIGGVLVEIGDDIIDGTVVGRLDTARRRLAG